MGVEKRMGSKELVAVSARSSTEIVESDVGFFGKIPARHAAIVDSKRRRACQNWATVGLAFTSCPVSW